MRRVNPSHAEEERNGGRVFAARCRTCSLVCLLHTAARAAPTLTTGGKSCMQKIKGLLSPPDPHTRRKHGSRPHLVVSGCIDTYIRYRGLAAPNSHRLYPSFFHGGGIGVSHTWDVSYCGTSTTAPTKGKPHNNHPEALKHHRSKRLATQYTTTNTRLPGYRSPRTTNKGC